MPKKKRGRPLGRKRNPDRTNTERQDRYRKRLKQQASIGSMRAPMRVENADELILAVVLQICDLLTLLPVEKRMDPLKIAMDTVKLRQAVHFKKQAAIRRLRE